MGRQSRERICSKTKQDLCSIPVVFERNGFGMANVDCRCSSVYKCLLDLGLNSKERYNHMDCSTVDNVDILWLSEAT